MVSATFTNIYILYYNIDNYIEFLNFILKNVIKIYNDWTVSTKNT